MSLPVVPWCPVCEAIAANCDLSHPLAFTEAQIIPPGLRVREGWFWSGNADDNWEASREKNELRPQFSCLVVELEP